MPPIDLPTYCVKCGRNLDARFNVDYAVYNLSCRHCPDVHLQISMLATMDHRSEAQQKTLREMVNRTADASGVSAMQTPQGHAAPSGIIQSGLVHITLPEGTNADTFQQELLEELQHFTITPFKLSARDDEWLTWQEYLTKQICSVFAITEDELNEIPSTPPSPSMPPTLLLNLEEVERILQAPEPEQEAGWWQAMIDSLSADYHRNKADGC